MADHIRIPVETGEPYEVVIGSGLLDSCGALIAERVAPCKAAVFADSNVAPLYLERAMASLRGAGFEAVSFVFPAGEENKRLTTLSDMLEFMAENRLTRTDLAMALGGGVTGDMTGFAAGCYLRGIRFVQLPTTLLAAVDASVGGKTAVDLKAGKNLAGLFWQPRAVICDTECLNTLTPELWADGAAEVIKTAVLGDAQLFERLEGGDIRENVQATVAACVKYKAAIVAAEERESGCRALLNLGHTVGHGVELLSGYRVSHGSAVAIGMAIVARAADKLGLSREKVAPRIVKALQACGLPTETQYTPRALAQAALSDKKRSGSTITLVVPEVVGSCLLKKTPVEDMEAFIAAGWEAQA